MKETLITLGWTCSPCNCPGSKGVDCANPAFPRVMISIRQVNRTQQQFRIIKKSLVVDVGFEYELNEKMIKNEILNS